MYTWFLILLHTFIVKMPQSTPSGDANKRKITDGHHRFQEHKLKYDLYKEIASQENLNELK